MIDRYQNGNVMYEGEKRDGRRHGKGRSRYDTWNNQIEYDGEWTNDLYHGFGVCFDERGDLIYDGNWKDGVRHGNGVVFENGRPAFEAVYRKGLLFEPEEPEVLSAERNQIANDASGIDRGWLFYASGQLAYAGAFKDEERAGRGQEFYPSGKIKFEGQFTNNMYHGTGRLHAVDGTLSHEGLFFCGSPYLGGWSSDNPNGFGILYHARVKVYEGDWYQGRLHGQGIARDRQSGFVEYEGEWKQGLRHGVGKEYRPEGVLVYEGEFVLGAREVVALDALDPNDCHCPVCFESFAEKKIVQLGCGHWLCRDCSLCVEICPLDRLPITVRAQRALSDFAKSKTQ